jgi:hypothetical protein
MRRPTSSARHLETFGQFCVLGHRNGKAPNFLLMTLMTSFVDKNIRQCGCTLHLPSPGQAARGAEAMSDEHSIDFYSSGDDEHYPCCATIP